MNDCGDFSDEADCSTSCKPGEHYCIPRGCISGEKLCNGIIDCADASDEDGCDRATTTRSSIPTTTTAATTPSKTNTARQNNMNSTRRCSLNEFPCTNWSECVPMSVRCDGYQDCFDRSDEINCTTIKRRGESVFSDMDCTYPDRICKTNGHCVRVDKLCDGAYRRIICFFFARVGQLAVVEWVYLIVNFSHSEQVSRIARTDQTKASTAKRSNATTIRNAHTFVTMRPKVSLARVHSIFF